MQKSERASARSCADRTTSSRLGWLRNHGHHHRRHERSQTRAQTRNKLQRWVNWGKPVNFLHDHQRPDRHPCLSVLLHRLPIAIAPNPYRLRQAPPPPPRRQTPRERHCVSLRPRRPAPSSRSLPACLPAARKETDMLYPAQEDIDRAVKPRSRKVHGQTRTAKRTKAIDESIMQSTHRPVDRLLPDPAIGGIADMRCRICQIPDTH